MFSEHGLLIGLQLVGRHRGKAVLLGVAKLFESAAEHAARRSPRCC